MRIILLDGTVSQLNGASIDIQPVGDLGRFQGITGIERYYIKATPMLLTEISHSTYIEKEKGDILGSAVILSAIVALVITTLAWSVNVQTGIAPDRDVVSAAKMFGERVTVQDSVYSAFEGCDKGDSRAYRVLDNETGKQVGVVCQGSSLRLFGISTKGATGRWLNRD